VAAFENDYNERRFHILYDRGRYFIGDATTERPNPNNKTRIVQIVPEDHHDGELWRVVQALKSV
jgi:hypothetical protein